MAVCSYGWLCVAMCCFMWLCVAKCGLVCVCVCNGLGWNDDVMLLCKTEAAGL